MGSSRTERATSESPLVRHGWLTPTVDFVVSCVRHGTWTSHAVPTLSCLRYGVLDLICPKSNSDAAECERQQQLSSSPVTLGLGFLSSQSANGSMLRQICCALCKHHCAPHLGQCPTTSAMLLLRTVRAPVPLSSTMPLSCREGTEGKPSLLPSLLFVRIVCMTSSALPRRDTLLPFSIGFQEKAV